MVLSFVLHDLIYICAGRTESSRNNAGAEWPLLLSGQSEDKKTCSTKFFRRASKAQLVLV